MDSGGTPGVGKSDGGDIDPGRSPGLWREEGHRHPKERAVDVVATPAMADIDVEETDAEDVAFSVVRP